MRKSQNIRVSQKKTQGKHDKSFLIETLSLERVFGFQGQDFIQKFLCWLTRLLLGINLSRENKYTFNPTYSIGCCGSSSTQHSFFISLFLFCNHHLLLTHSLNIIICDHAIMILQRQNLQIGLLISSEQYYDIMPVMIERQGEV